MRTLGIDLATKNGQTGLCEVEWTAEGATATVAVEKPSTNQDLVLKIQSVLRRGGWVAIDAPFGFPKAFTDAILVWDASGRVEDRGRLTHPEWLDNSCNWEPVNRRITDAFVRVQQGKLERKAGDTSSRWPLSSVVEQITPTTIRCAEIMSAAVPGRLNRVGDSRIVETYPVAALRLWGISSGAYKKDMRERERVLRDIYDQAPWLNLEASDDWKYDDAIDALLCALIARLAADSKRSSWPESAGVAVDLDIVAQEGWIHLPKPGTNINDLLRH